MGYYDQHRQTKTKQTNTFKSIGIGVLTGAVATLLLLLFFFQAGPTTNETNQAAVQPNDSVVVPQPQPQQIYPALTGAVEKVSGAVVGVTNIQQNMFLNQNQEVGTGSGVIYKKENDKAFIVTNNHVINKAKELEVTLSDGSKLPAKLLGTDVITDLAVLQIDGKNVKTVAKLGDSEHLKLAEPVLAIGNPLGQRFSGTVTQGIISSKERSIPVDMNGDGRPDWQADVIQTDAAINPGNSGGALINEQGEVIGINSMKIAQQSVEGIGFAIPTSIVKPIIQDLERYNKVQRPFMGVGLKPLSEIPSYNQQETLQLPSSVKAGVAVINVVPGSPAAKAGIKELDTIVALDDEQVASDLDIRKYLYTKKKIGDLMDVTIYRNGKKQTVKLKLTSSDTF